MSPRPLRSGVWAGVRGRTRTAVVGSGVVLLAAVISSCATPPTPPPVVTRPQPGLESAPTRTPPLRQLPPALAVDPTKLTPAPLELDLKQPEVLTLPNGLTLYLLEDHTTPLVLFRAVLPVGSIDDPAGKLGLASVMASLLSEGGAGARSAEAVDQLLEQQAADLGSGAGEEYSTASLSVRAEDAATLLPVFADVLQRPRFEQARFEIAVNRLREGIRRREDRPDGVASRALSKAVFGPASLLGREATDATVQALTRDDVLKLYAAAVGPRRSRLVITGDFDRAALLEQVRQAFGGWKGGALPERSWAAAAPLQRRVIVVPRKIAQAKVRIGARGFTRDTPLEFPLRLVNTALGSFGVGRLYREIRDERGLAYSAFSSVSPGPTSGLFTAGFDTKPEQVSEALEVATRILHEVSTSAPLSAGELRVARDMAVNTFAFRFDTASKIALERATFDHFGYAPGYLATWRDRIGAVTPAQASEAARQLDDGLQIIVVGPPEKLGDLSRFGPVSTISDVEQFR
jgi:zinc protease